MLNEKKIKTERLRRKIDFERVFKSGRRWNCSLFIILFLPNPFFKTRFGITIKKNIGIAVVRNRIKRLIRESILNYAKNLNWGIDIVVIPFKAIRDAGLTEVKRDIERFFDHIEFSDVFEKKLFEYK